MWSRRRLALALIPVGLAGLLVLSLGLQCELPQPTGPNAVGRATLRWVDATRPEALTASTTDFREIIAAVWYPAAAGTGTPAPYVPDLERVAPELARSGEVTPLEVFGLHFVRSRERLGAALAGAGPYPVVLLSPGNGTNVEFYAALADDLASHGYIVVGLNHPYDVAAVALADGSVARFAGEQASMDAQARATFVTERVAVRTQDLVFALDQLAALNADPASPFAGRFDLARVASMGHSLGGITAVQACRADARFRACLNFDGLQRGGPFSTEVHPEAPTQPFMFITKETQLDPRLSAGFQAVAGGSFLVTLPQANHDSFTDGPLLLPSLLPLPNKADRLLALSRAYTLAFFDLTLLGRPSTLLAQPSHSSEVVVEVYPPHQALNR